MLTPEQKAQAVRYLTSLPPWKGADAVLNGLQDDHLVAIYNDQVKLQEADGVYNSVREYLGDGALVVNAMPAALAAKKAACKCPDEGATTNKTTAVAPAAPAGDGTVEGWFKAVNAPPAVIQVVTNALGIVAERKAELVGKLTAHITDAAKKTAAEATFNKMEAADLAVLVANMAPAAQPAVAHVAPPIPARLQPIYVGNAGGGNGGGSPNAPAPTTNGEVKPLGLPTLGADYWKADAGK